MLDKLANVLGGIVTVALVGVIVASPNTAKIIQATGSSFSGAIKSAKH